MAKKKYNAPCIQCVEVKPLCMLVSSVKIGISSNTEMDAGMSFSNSCEWQREEWDE